MNQSTESVLMVEDDAALREALIDTLRSAGITVFGASDAPSALQVLETEEIALVVSDVQMPGPSGYDLLSSIKRLRPDLPVTLEIIVTNARIFPYFDEKFWAAYRNQPAWEFARFLKIAEQGHAREPLPPLKGEAAQARERADLEASITFTRNILNV